MDELSHFITAETKPKLKTTFRYISENIHWAFSFPKVFNPEYCSKYRS